MPTRTIRLGCRRSPLAQTQAAQIADALAAASGLERRAIRLVPIATSGDARLDVALADIGGKGLFTAELEAALRAGEIEGAVHSLKDLSSRMDEDLHIAAIPARADARDALIVPQGWQVPKGADALEILPNGARVGTASLRRQAQLRRVRPDVRCELLRGNIATRLKKLDASLAAPPPLFGILAVCGLERQGLMARAAAILPEDLMLPAAGQGALAIQSLAAKSDLTALFRTLEHEESRQTVTAERAFLAELEGSCRLPIAARAHIHGGELQLTGRLLSHDGQTLGEARARAPRQKSADAGRRAAAEIRRRHGALLASLA